MLCTRWDHWGIIHLELLKRGEVLFHKWQQALAIHAE